MECVYIYMYIEARVNKWIVDPQQMISNKEQISVECRVIDSNKIEMTNYEK